MVRNGWRSDKSAAIRDEEGSAWGYRCPIVRAVIRKGWRPCVARLSRCCRRLTGGRPGTKMIRACLPRLRMVGASERAMRTRVFCDSDDLMKIL